MFPTGNNYDRGVNTFSPEGRLFQVEYAIEAIKLGSTALGIQTEDGVVLAVEKRLSSPLMEPSSVEKVMEIDEHIGCAMSGLTADARTLVEHARVTTQFHRFSFDCAMSTESCTQSICDLALKFGEKGKDDDSALSRPFGVALLVAGVDEEGPRLYHTDPSGTFTKYDAKAIGAGSENAQNTLQQEYSRSMTFAEAEMLAIRILKDVMEEKVNPLNVEVAAVRDVPGSTRKFTVYSQDQVAAIIASPISPLPLSVSHAHARGCLSLSLCPLHLRVPCRAT